MCSVLSTHRTDLSGIGRTEIGDFSFMKSHWNSFLLVLTMAFFPLFGRANGNGVGNGGDAIICHSSEQNHFQGFYSLDYLAFYDPLNPPVAVSSINDSLNHIENLLQQKLPELSQSFRRFRSHFLNVTDPSKEHFWIASPSGLADIKDENFHALVPENCRWKNEIHLAQAMIRFDSKSPGDPDNKVIFYYSAGVIDAMESTDAHQVSFLLVHEWLWEHSHNVHRNRQLNYLLHSELFNKLSRKEVRDQLKAFDFKLHPLN